MNHTLMLIFFSLLLLPGAVFVFIPMMPSLSYMFIVALIFALIGKFAILTPMHLLILASVWCATIVVDNVAGLVGAKIGGASLKSVLGGAVGGIIGFGLFPPLGVFLGIFLGVLIGELARDRSIGQAFRAGFGGLLGSATGMLVNFALAVAFIVLFIVFSW